MKNGLVLSGGGARGFAHLGVIEALCELEIPVHAVSGTSAGAICGAFFAAGYKAEETMRFISEYKAYKWLRLLWRKPGLLNMQTVASVFSRYLPDKFEDLRIPLTTTATDLIHGELCYFDKGPLVPAVCASACIPVLFDPWHINGSVFVDGGVLNNFPVEPLDKDDFRLIGVHVNPIDTNVKDLHFRDVMDRSMHLALRHTLPQKAERCAIYIEPPACAYTGIFDINDAGVLYEAGYLAAMDRREDLLKLKS